MGILKKLFGLERAAPPSSLSSAGEWLTSTGAFRGAPHRGTRELLAAYRQSPWLRAVASRIARGVASAQWSVYVRAAEPMRGGTSFGSRKRVGHHGRFLDVGPGPVFRWGEDRAVRDLKLTSGTTEQRAAHRRELAKAGLLREVVDHPLLTLLASPNTELTGRSCIQVTQTWLDIKGEAFWLLSRDKSNGRPTEFLPLAPHWVSQVPTKEKPVFRVSFNALQLEVPPGDMIWLRDPDPENPYGRGTGVAESLGDELETDEFAAKYVKNWFFNSGLPSAIVSFEGATPDVVKRLREEWENNHRGYSNAHRVHFAVGSMNAQRLDASFADQEVTELRKLERDTIAQVFAMPPELIGIIENSNRSTIGAARYIYALGVEHPRAEFLRTELQAQLTPLFDGAIALECEVAIPDDEDRRLNVLRAMPGAFALNEWREEAGYESLPQFEGVFPPLALPGQEQPQVNTEEPKAQPSDEVDGVELKADPPWTRDLHA